MGKRTSKMLISLYFTQIQQVSLRSTRVMFNISDFLSQFMDENKKGTCNRFLQLSFILT